MPEITITKSETKTFNVDTLDMSAVRALHAAGWRVEEVDGECVEGFCEVCGKPLFEHDDYEMDAEGIIWCKDNECGEFSIGG